MTVLSTVLAVVRMLDRVVRLLSASVPVAVIVELSMVSDLLAYPA